MLHLLGPLCIFCTTFVKRVSSRHASNASPTRSNSWRFLLHNFWPAHGGTFLKAVIAKLSAPVEATKGMPCLNARLNPFPLVRLMTTPSASGKPSACFNFSSGGFVHNYSQSYRSRLMQIHDKLQRHLYHKAAHLNVSDKRGELTFVSVF